MSTWVRSLGVTPSLGGIMFRGTKAPLLSKWSVWLWRGIIVKWKST